MAAFLFLFLIFVCVFLRIFIFNVELMMSVDVLDSQVGDACIVVAL